MIAGAMESRPGDWFSIFVMIWFVPTRISLSDSRVQRCLRGRIRVVIIQTSIGLTGSQMTLLDGAGKFEPDNDDHPRVNEME